MKHIFCIHSLAEEHLGYFQILAITNKADMNIVEHKPFWYDGASFGYMPKNGIGRSSRRAISNFFKEAPD